MEQLLQEIQLCCRLPANQQIRQYQEIFRVCAISNPRVKSIYQDSINLKEIDARVEQANFYDGEWLAFNEMVISFIRLCNQINLWSLVELFDLYGKFLEDASTAFSNYNRGWILRELIKQTINYISPMASRLDYQFYQKENCTRPRLLWLASILLKIFNNIRSQTNEESKQKASIILFVGCKLCLVYFKIDNPLLCRNVFSNINTLNLKALEYSKNEIMTYRYYLARFYLIKNQLVDSYQHLVWCLTHCPNISNHPNIIRILRLLLPVSILIGKRPNFRLIGSTFFSGDIPLFLFIYQGLSEAISLGNFKHYNQVVSEHSKFFKQYGLLLAIENKAPILVVRNLFKKLWYALGKAPALDFDNLLTALKCSKINVDIDDSIIENLAVSLIDQNLMKGKVLWSRAVTLAREEPFPAVDQINFVKFGNGDETTLNGNDLWLNH